MAMREWKMCIASERSLIAKVLHQIRSRDHASARALWRETRHQYL